MIRYKAMSMETYGGHYGIQECSAVAIVAITGSDVQDMKRTLFETVMEIEDRGYIRDASPTRKWRGKTVEQLASGSDIELGIASISETAEHESHVMPIIKGKLLNRVGWHDERIAAVFSFKKPERTCNKRDTAKFVAAL